MKQNAPAHPSSRFSLSRNRTTLLLAILIFLFACSGAAIYLVIDKSVSLQRTALNKQVRRSARAMEISYLNFIDDLQSYATTSDFSDFLAWGNEENPTFRKLKRIYSRHQDYITRIVIQDIRGRWLAIYRTPDNYFLISRHLQTGKLFYENTLTEAYQTDDEMQSVEPIRDNTGKIIARLIVTCDLSHARKSEKSLVVA